MRRSTDNVDFSDVVTVHPTESVIGVASSALGTFTGGRVFMDHAGDVLVGIGKPLALPRARRHALDANLDAALGLLLGLDRLDENLVFQALDAVRAGAADYIPKPTSTSEMTGADIYKRELVEKVKALGAAQTRRGRRPRG